MPEFVVSLRRPHARQQEFLSCTKPRIIIRAGRRGGKTTGVGIFGVQQFLAGRRVLYAAPTSEQSAKFWFEIQRALAAPVAAGVFRVNQTERFIELPGTEQRIRAKTAWNANTLRGDYADVLIFDEWQLSNEDAWGEIGVPMLLDNNGRAVFIYTPPSLHSSGVTKASDPRHATKLYRAAQADTSGRWAAFTFSSHENPHISAVALAEITLDMTTTAYRQEILAEDIENAPGALWQREWLDAGRVLQAPPLTRLVVAVDPPATSGGDACGIVAAGERDGQLFVLEDATIQGSPETWARAAVTLCHKLQADALVAEANQGGEMVRSVLNQVDPRLPVKLVYATRGKAVRAEPVSALYEQGRAHHVGELPLLEDELCQWEPGGPSPNRLDALVWAATELIIDSERVERVWVDVGVSIGY